MELKSIIEAILFGSPKAMTLAEIKETLATTAERSEELEIKAFKKVKIPELSSTLDALADEFNQIGRSFRLVCVGGSWQFITMPEFGPWLRVVAGEKIRPPKLSQPALETLAIIAYRQPLTRTDIEQIRGVSVDGVMQTLVERGLVEQVGRAEVVGRPSMYGTTPLFLEYFGLADLNELPDADELRKVEVKRAEPLQTVESTEESGTLPDAAVPPSEATPTDDVQFALPLDTPVPELPAPSHPESLP